jgi:hypothetical protein
VRTVQKNISVARPHAYNEELKAIEAVMRSAMLAQGEAVAGFKNQFAQHIGVRGAIAASSSTAALDIALKTLRIKQGHEAQRRSHLSRQRTAFYTKNLGLPLLSRRHHPFSALKCHVRASRQSYHDMSV